MLLPHLGQNTVTNTSPYTRYGRSYEPILICRKGEAEAGCVHLSSDVIEVSKRNYKGIQEQKYYQAQKPVELIEKLILDMSPPESTICDFLRRFRHNGASPRCVKSDV